ncbi:hypothetical protein [Rheinheimera sp.]|uniref:hypothetical protein n=1 Tax=Rheinheimera sp. TaxID=1869214 RepID=UPI002736B3E2|nr:hypothetical protein [Rheinheimera sp.]MDP2716436.1 hypothetical protein [Rheinheimera sp.]
MKYSSSLCSIVFLLPHFTHGVESECPITLSQHSTDKNRTSKPAYIQYIKSNKDDENKEDKESYSIDAALSVSCPINETSEFMFAVEGHKNDLTTKESDSLAARAGWSTNRYKDKNYGFMTSIGYISDHVKDTKSIQVIADLDFLKNNWYLNNYWIGDSTAFMWSPTLAIEYENFINQADSKEGSVIRGMLGISGTYAFWEDKVSGVYKLVFNVSYNKWLNFNDSKKLELPKNHELATVSLSYIIEKTKNYEISLSYKYNNGEDIRNKIADNKYDQLGLGISVIFK